MTFSVFMYNSFLFSRNITKTSPSSCFHIDIYTLQNGKVFNLTNLACLMDNTDTATKLRRLIIDKYVLCVLLSCTVLCNVINTSSNIWEQHLQIKIVFMKRLRAD
jgi:hypothetical protein